MVQLYLLNATKIGEDNKPWAKIAQEACDFWIKSGGSLVEGYTQSTAVPFASYEFPLLSQSAWGYFQAHMHQLDFKRTRNIDKKRLTALMCFPNTKTLSFSDIEIAIIATDISRLPNDMHKMPLSEIECKIQRARAGFLGRRGQIIGFRYNPTDLVGKTEELFEPVLVIS